MKTKLFIISLSLIWLMGTSCQKDEFDLKSPDVDQFVSILKSGFWRYSGVLLLIR